MNGQLLAQQTPPVPNIPGPPGQMWEVEVDGRVFQVEAPNEQAAVRAARELLERQRQQYTQANVPPGGIQPATGTPLATALGQSAEPPPGPIRSDPFAGATHEQPPTIAPSFPAMNNWEENAPYGMAVLRGATLATSDELAGLGGGIASALRGDQFSEGYNARRDEYNDVIQALQARDPGGALGAEIFGGLMSGYGAGRAGVSLVRGAKPTIPSLLGRMTLEGSVYGAIYGAGAAGDENDTIEARLRGALEGAKTGAVTGAVFGIPLSVIGRARMAAAPILDRFRNTNTSRLPKDNPLRQQATQHYEAMRQAGVMFDTGAANVLRSNIYNAALDAVPEYRTLVQSGRWNEIPQDVREALQIASTINGNRLTQNAVGLDELDVLRRFISDSTYNSQSDVVRRIGGAMRAEIDRFVNAMDPSTIVAGVNPNTARSMLLEGRSMWSDLMTAEDVHDAFYRAANQGGSATNLRTQFRRLSNDSQFMENLTQAERQAVLLVAREDSTTQQIIDGLMRFLPGRGLNWQSLLGGLVGFQALGGVAGNPAVAGTGAVVGMALPGALRSALGTARNITTRGNQNAAELMFRNRGVPVTPGIEGVTGALLSGSQSWAPVAQDEMMRRITSALGL